MFSNWPIPSSSTMPPDIVLELGPLPFSRFAAHSSLLIAHSGYFRSVLRLDEHHHPNTNRVIYVPNLTAEHFAPLLTYIYTGYLDLTIENIFGVLLGTHVLHMPRALEICRSFLARIPADGYFGNTFQTQQPQPTNSIADKELEQGMDNVKVIRPIASKAMNSSGLMFVAPPISKALLPSQDTPFRTCQSVSNANDKDDTDENDKVEIEVNSDDSKEMLSESPKASTSQEIVNTILPTTIQKKLSHTSMKRLVKSKHSKNATTIDKTILQTIRSNDDSNDKIVIDIASCDGPVRFQRVLNNSYGNIINASSSSPSSTSNERKRSNVTNSFHLQMARNISERRIFNASADIGNSISGSIDSENSQEIVVHVKSNSNEIEKNDKNSSNSHGSDIGITKNDEPYNCVYCKHSFKSQYCYQKHAKRHINPLSIDGDVIVDTNDSDSDKDDKSNSNHSSVPIMNGPTGSGSGSACNNGRNFKREVRPLDMNVQYYPCKTCGSKFPSYYFVHKHRKMCHANEEN